MQRGKANFLIDGQFGSTGKGLMASWLAEHVEETIHVATTNASANAGHTTVFADGTKMVLYHLPTVGVLRRNTRIYLNAGSIIDPEVLTQEINMCEGRGFDVAARLVIHPRAAVIRPRHRDEETDPGSAATKIASTQHGVGAALAEKIKRTGSNVAISSGELQWANIRDLHLNERMARCETISVEVPQGMGLGINYGFSYPYCTSREVGIAQAMSDAGIHPSFLGDVVLTVRTYPIRVGNIPGGYSGDWYPDQYEIDWKEVGVEPEITTVTKRPRRIATFSQLQFREAVTMARPTMVFLNFLQYALFRESGMSLLTMMVGMEDTLRDVMGHDVPLLYGIGPKVSDVYTDLAQAVDACRGSR